MLFFRQIRFLRVLALGVLAAGPLWVWGQEDGAAPMIRIQGGNVPRDMFPPEMLPPVPLSEEERATIERSIEDLKSDNSEVRAGAVMILGKYEHTHAREAVIGVLRDPSARVRRAALVSVVEWSRGAPGSAVMPVLELLGDDDVEIRRAASSSLSAMMGIRRTYQVIRPQSGLAGDLPPGVEAVMRRAFQDEDVLVRRNMLANYHALGLSLAPEAWEALLTDVDRQVRLAALPLAGRHAPQDVFYRQAAALTESEDRVERLQLAREMATRGSRPEAREVLVVLAADGDREVAAEALIGRLRFESSRSLMQEAVRRLLEGDMTQEQGVRFFRVMRINPAEAAPYLPRLIELEDATLRREAVAVYLDVGLGRQRPDVFKQLLADRSPEVRQEVVHHLVSESGRLNPALVEMMLASPYPDVRAGLIHGTGHMPAERAADVLFDLLLDERQDIRTRALRDIVERRLPGWSQALSATLRDPDTQMQRIALGLIFRNPYEGDRAALLRFLEEYPESPLAMPIRAHLGAQPAGS